MWYRIELNKDGSVSSCVEVESGLKSGKTVHYVEADSKEFAASLAVARWRKAIQVRTELCSKGLCIQCKKPKSTKSALRCAECITANATEKREAAETKAALAEPRVKRKPNAPCPPLSVYKATLEAFDRLTPERFRGWLVSRLIECRG